MNKKMVCNDACNEGILPVDAKTITIYLSVQESVAHFCSLGPNGQQPKKFWYSFFGSWNVFFLTSQTFSCSSRTRSVPRSGLYSSKEWRAERRSRCFSATSCVTYLVDILRSTGKSLYDPSAEKIRIRSADYKDRDMFFGSTEYRSSRIHNENRGIGENYRIQLFDNLHQVTIGS